MEADGVDQVVEDVRFDRKDAFETEAGRGKGGLKCIYCCGSGGIFGLGGQHESDQGLEALVLVFSGSAKEP